MDELSKKESFMALLTGNVIQDPCAYPMATIASIYSTNYPSRQRFVVESDAGQSAETDIRSILALPLACSWQHERSIRKDAMIIIHRCFHCIRRAASSSQYLRKDYQAAAVLGGAALEEALKARALAIPLELSGKETLVPLLHRLKDKTVRLLTEFEATNLEAVAKMRNDAAHGPVRIHQGNRYEEALKKIRNHSGKSVRTTLLI